MFTFFSKKRSGLAGIVLIAFSLNVAAYADSYEQGLEYLKRAKEAKTTVRLKAERRYLEYAYKNFKESNQKNARLLQVYTGILISETNRIKLVAARFVKNYRNRYISMIADLEILELKEKKKLKTYMLDIERQIPYLADIDVSKTFIYPFRGDTPGVRFSLAAAADVVLKIDRSVQSRGRFRKGTHSLTFKWLITYMDKRTLDLELNADNDFIGESGKNKIVVDVDIPYNLSYHNGKYKVRGEDFRDESKTVTRMNGNNLLGVLLGAAIGALVYSVKKDSETGEVYTKEERRDRGMLIGGLIAGYSLIRFLLYPRHVSVPHSENIRYNQALRERIEQLKRDVKVNLRVRDEK